MRSEISVRKVEFIQHNDLRGQLVVAECGEDIPFEVKRIFYIYNSDTDAVRGQHANRKTQFVLINLVGKCKVKVKNIGGGGGNFLFRSPLYRIIPSSNGMERDV